MERCFNPKTSTDEIKFVEQQARRLLREVQEIDFCMTIEEQQGLYSLIDALVWEREERVRETQRVYERIGQHARSQHSPALQKILDAVADKEITNDHAE